MKKNFLKLFICLFVLFLTTSSLVASAKKYIIDEEDDENPGGETVLSIENEKYYVQVNDETGYSYFCVEENGNVTILGTCEVVLVDRTNPNGVVIGVEAADLVSYGKLVVIENSNGAYVLDIEGSLVQYFSVNDKLVVTE